MNNKQKQTILIILLVISSILILTLNQRAFLTVNAQTLSTSTTDPLVETSFPITLTALSSSIPNQPVFTPTLNDACPNPIVTNVNQRVGFDFETGIECWNTSEGSYKLAQLDITNLISHSGSRSLIVSTQLYGDKSPQVLKITDTKAREIFQHTEITAYMNQAIPEGYSTPGPYDLSGKTIACFVYLPPAFTNAGRPWPYIKIFAKDVGYANLFSQALDIDTKQVGHWIKLSLVVKSQGDFDATLTNTIGIRIDTGLGSKLTFVGNIFIDDCTIG